MPENTPGDPPPPFANIVISVVRCADGSALTNFFFKNLTTGKVTPGAINSNLFALFNAFPGFMFEISRVGYNATQHKLSSQEVADKFAEVCLAEAPPPPPPPGGPICVLASAALGVEREEGAASGVLALYRTIREAILTANRGRRLVERYYSEEVSRAGISALETDPDLRRDFLIFLLELTPFLSEFADTRGRAEALVSSEVRFNPNVTRHGVEILQRFAQAAGGVLDNEVAEATEILEFAAGKLAGEILSYLDAS
jgi:hypothetical protein